METTIYTPTVVNTSNIFSNTTDFRVSGTISEKASEFFSQPLRVASFFICIVGLLANALSIAATANIPHGQSTHSKLIISLGLSDSLILVAIVLYEVFYILSDSNACEKMMKSFILDVALLATLSNLLVMAIDHYLAIMKPLHYRRFMSKLRGNLVIIGIWAFSVFCGLLDFIVGSFLEKESDMSYCEAITRDGFNLDLIVLSFIFVVLLGIVIIYVSIYILVKRIMLRDRTLYQDEMHSYKAIVTTMLIIGSFTLLWAPDGIFQVFLYVCQTDEKCLTYLINHYNELLLVNDIFFLMLQLNSLADPLIYAIRLTEVQRGYKILYYKLFPGRMPSGSAEYFCRRSSLASNRRDTYSTIAQDNLNNDTNGRKDMLSFCKPVHEENENKSVNKDDCESKNNLTQTKNDCEMSDIVDLNISDLTATNIS